MTPILYGQVVQTDYTHADGQRSITSAGRKKW